MRSLFAKILLWFWFTLVITVVGSALISAIFVDETDRRAPVGRLVEFQLELARRSYESGGKSGLATFLARLESIFDATGILTDQNGRDLLTGEDRSELIRRARWRRYGIFRMGPRIVARSTADGKYWFFFVVERAQVGPWFLRPEHLWVIGVAILLCYALAYYLTRPLRKLQRAVERFGRGDLSARVASRRRDELGQLARTFDRMADRIETLLGAERRLLLDISHELRSPLARLGVAVELARSGDDPDSALNRIQKESERLNSLVSGLLQVTRAEGDPASLSMEPVRLDELVKELAADASIEAHARGNDLRVEAGTAAVVQGNAELLRRAVENVIRNAIRHSPRGPAVDVNLRSRDGCAVVQVRDYGAGVPEEALPRIFDPFYRVETDRDRASGGTGLGLSIARRAIELHKGSIRAVNSHPGLLVEIEIPAVRSDAPEGE
jgi:two-component system sensor histidine kinase CpxA